MIGDRIGDLFSYFITMIMFLISIFIFIWEFDIIKDDAVKDMTLEFVNECQCTGVISPRNYMQFTTKIGSLGNYYAEMQYESLRSYPEEDNAGNVTGYFRDYYAYNNQDILDAMYSDTEQDYEMKVGDKLIVSVRARGTQTSRWVGMVLGDNNANQLIARRMGTIGNNVLGD